ncbi:PA0069 family radical SAM protein [Bdellovibrio reynosensis]|uniref:PA0069 family radical SAM protein n=1 Tax=Bdellovibrio reynosensis TaxID=2835041 RepID=A0ABY4C782_9BACT|nr:PA0069 family radical SAM protein [Bdellovibrio reynosensis]UOE99776.1 PA0069 family radical SAM protein [Bdellovibrio reynosensis]
MAREFRKDIRGRGASSNVTNRYDTLKYEATEEDFDNYETEKSLLKTEVLKDSSRSIITKNNSPDIGFEFSVNPYRGCEHGCAYCYARPSHEYLGFSPGLDFESKIVIKETAPELLREALMKPSWKPAVIMMSGITDCYQPLERKYELTRGCLRVLADFKNPVSMITKNALITRDIDIFKEMIEYDGIKIYISVTTLDPELGKVLEPRTSRPQARLQAIEALANAGVPVGVNVAPCIPGLNDHELPQILKAASEAGATSAGYTPLRLPSSVLPIFEEWLEVHQPLKKEKVLNSVRDIRGGKLNDAQFGSRMRGEGPRADQMAQMFALYTRKYNLNMKHFNLSTAHFQRPGDQLKFNIE